MPEPNDATGYTEEANQAVLNDEHLDWHSVEDSEAAQKGFVAKLDPPVIKNA